LGFPDSKHADNGCTDEETATAKNNGPKATAKVHPDKKKYYNDLKDVKMRKQHTKDLKIWKQIWKRHNNTPWFEINER